jgi:hypothetical protein
VSGATAWGSVWVMSEGPSKREIERAREAMERHDAELRDEEEPSPEEADEPPGDEEDER